MVLILGSLTAFGPLSMDMYLPALPIVTKDLQTTTSLAQLSITTCLIGLGAGQLIFGPLSDIHGRRKPLMVTLLLYATASIFCALSTHIWLFISFRFIQGFTGAAGIVIARASARDLYSGKNLTRFMALLALVNGAAPILAPIFGGIVLNWATWPVVFYILAMIGFIMFFSIVLLFPETLSKGERTEGNLMAILTTFRQLMKDRLFMGIVLTQSFISMSMFAYIAGSPFILQNLYGVSPQQYSFIFAMNGLGIILAAQITGRLVNIFEEVNLLRVGIVISFIGSSMLLGLILIKGSLLFIMIALFLVVSSVGIVNPTSFSMGMRRQGKVAGSASAFLGIVPFVGGGIVSPLVGILGEQNALPMGIVILSCSFLAFSLFMIAVRGQKL